MLYVYICPPVVAVFVLGLFWTRANSNGAFKSLIFGFVFAIFLIISSITDLWPALNEIHFLHMAFFLFVICAFIQIAVSLASDAMDNAQIDPYIWHKQLFSRRNH